MQTIGVMLRCHRRHRTLRCVLTALRRWTNWAKIQIHASCDRTTPEVDAVLDEFDDLVIAREVPPAPVLAPGRDGWRSHKSWQYQAMTGWRAGPRRPLIEPDWCILQDDDCWLEPLSAEAQLFRDGLLESGEYDLISAKSLFMWDKPTRYNIRRQHQSPYLWRFVPHDRFPLTRDIRATEIAHDQAIMRGRHVLLGVPLLDYGAYTAGDRKAVYDAYVEAGRDVERDAFVRSLVEQPQLQTLKFHGEWLDLFSDPSAGDRGPVRTQDPVPGS